MADQFAPGGSPLLVCYNGKLITPTYGYGLCECGCGERTTIPISNNLKHGHASGQPIRFIKGHHPRLQGPDWSALDCGYARGGPCWIWKKLLDVNGYGRITIHGKNRRATRSYYQHHIGSIAEGNHLDHLCRVRACVNPWHLEPVPPASNVRRGAKSLYTEDDIKRMMEMRNRGIFYKDIALYFGTKTEYIQAICYGKRWKGIVEQKELPSKTNRTPKDEYQQMIQMRERGMAGPDIARELGVTQWRVFAALRRKGFGRATTGRHTRIKVAVVGLQPDSVPTQTAQ